MDGQLLEYEQWLELRKKTKSEDGKLCYCGHTYKCDCLDPGIKLFTESVKRGTIILGDEKNGWKISIPHKKITLDNITSEEIRAEESKNYKMKETNMSNLPIDDLEDAVLLVCEFVNDLAHGQGLMAYADNIPLMLAAWSGKENIIPQAKDIDEIEKGTLKAKVAEKLKLSGEVEDIVNDGIEILFLGNRIREKILALQAPVEPPV